MHPPGRENSSRSFVLLYSSKPRMQGISKLQLKQYLRATSEIPAVHSLRVGIATLHLNVRNFPVLGFSHQFFCADVSKCLRICSQASPPTPLVSDVPSCPPKIGEGATSPPSTLLGCLNEIRCHQTPSSAWD